MHRSRNQGVTALPKEVIPEVAAQSTGCPWDSPMCNDSLAVITDCHGDSTVTSPSKWHASGRRRNMHASALMCTTALSWRVQGPWWLN